jgi:hypothetical protein
MAAKRKTAATQHTGEYDVGYGKPPAHSRFKPGNSANPRGRPKGSKNKAPTWSQGGFDALIREEAYRSFTMNDNGRPVTMPLMQAVIRRVGLDALNGRARAQKLLLNDLIGQAERRNNALFESYQGAMITYKVEQRQRLDDILAAGGKPPDLVPHPDDIIINNSTGEPSFIGPRTHEDRVHWEFLAKTREQQRTALTHFKAELETSDDDEDRSYLKQRIEQTTEMLNRIVQDIGEWPKHHTERQPKYKHRSWNRPKKDAQDMPPA